MNADNTFYYAKLSQLGIEEWMDVCGWEGYYQVSNLGRVRGLPRRVQKKKSKGVKLSVQATTFFVKGRVMKPSSHRSGHKRIVFRRDDKPETHQVHKLVMMAFVGECPEGMEICHNNGDPANNYLYNLRYDTHANNVRDQERHGTRNPAKGEDSGSAKLTEEDVKQIRQRFDSGEMQKSIHKDFSVGKTTINSVCRRKTWPHV